MDGARTTSWHIELPHAPPAAPIARAVVRNALTELESGVDGETAELLVCELVTNAVEHTADDAAVSLTVAQLGEGVLVEVRDHDPRPLAGLPVEGDPQPLEELVRDETASPAENPAPAPVPGGPQGPGGPKGLETLNGPEEPEEGLETLETMSLEDIPEDGRGLLLIRSLSAECGSRATRHGKTVWFTLTPER